MAESAVPQHHLPEPGAGHRPLVILAPTDLNVRSNGHACILTLAIDLLKAGHAVYLLPYRPFTFFRRFYHRLPPRHRGLPFISDLSELPSADLLVPESAPPKLVRRLRQNHGRIIWWLLAPAGLLTAFKPRIQPGDSLLAFSEFVLPDQADYLFIQPPAEPALAHSAHKHRPQPPRRAQIAFYTGKGRLRPLPAQLHRMLLKHQVVAITRTFPASKRSLVQLLEQSNGLISCDPLTNLSLEAAMLGTPTFLVGNPFSRQSYARFPAALTDYVTDSADEYIAWLQRTGPVRQLRTAGLLDKSHAAAGLLASVLREAPDAADAPFRVSTSTLAAIRHYRQTLAASRTIQAIRDGQSVSSLFLRLYLLSLKTPYRYHRILCAFLHAVDEIGEVLDQLGILRVFFVALGLLFWPLLAPRRLAKRLRRRLRSKPSP
jgi:hypothetical protein